ncbi:hypothetical protein [Paenibacillus chitinolyticus]|uniref:hypothetical protein n=1 Tax=Paenibacillus chitinolyticus TaxID=79263 RepID=UPI00364FBE95
MKKEFSKLVASATILSSALLISVATASAAPALFSVSSNDSLKSIGIGPYEIKDTLTWTLDGSKTDPKNTGFSVTGGYGNVKLFAKNTGTHSFRIEVKHDYKNTVIFDQTVQPGDTVNPINNNDSPAVPAGNYTVQIYGGKGFPKGEVVLKSSDTQWPNN